jgi:hypothetical protein
MNFIEATQALWNPQPVIRVYEAYTSPATGNKSYIWQCVDPDGFRRIGSSPSNALATYVKDKNAFLPQ